MKRPRLLIRTVSVLAITFAMLATAGIGLLLESKTYIFSITPEPSQTEAESAAFPVGVNAFSKTIVEQPDVESYYTLTLARSDEPTSAWQHFVAALLMSKAWYQNLASPVSRIAVIWPGERHEEVVDHFGDILDWNDDERERFALAIQTMEPVMNEGKFFPGSYVTHRYATPEEVAALIQERFATEILSRYTPEVATNVPLEDALTIASLIEREASDFENMREVSGVIWNRLFIDMPLQLDATLQYARGSKPTEASWWPVPRPRDKFIDSPYNTYLYEGLPPGPIANPSTDALLAALNPRLTDCLYYFHADDGSYYCSVTYEEHVASLKTVFGQGR